ncbi:MAG TPA: rhomboid family intramembrane serine protease [Bryobacteraceae bacterium]|nr:rhomboid family intramembrane serine protease [Bryobacteraceae bacterium]
MCPNCRAFITTDDRVCPYCNVQVGPRAVERRMTADALGGWIPHARFTTMMLILINAGFYIATVLYSMRTNAQGGAMNLDGQTLFAFGAKFGPAIAQGQWWRLITAGFLHGGLLHIGMNMWVLFDVGTQVEQVFGTSRYLAIYLISGITGFMASTFWAPAVLSIGASAAIFGLIGAMIAFGIRDRHIGPAVRALYIRWAIYGLIIGFIGIFAIDNAAHIGGLIGGFLVAYIAGTPTYSAAIERFWQIAAGCVVLVTLYSFAEVFLGLAK